MNNLAEKFGDVDAVLITSPINRRYFTGFNSSAGMYLMTNDKNYFLVDFRYITAAKLGLKGCEIIQTEKNKTYNDILNQIFAEKNIKTLGIEYETMTIAEFESLKNSLDVTFCNASIGIQDIRGRKTDEETAKMQAAQDITDATFIEVVEYIRQNYKKGITERDIAKKLVESMSQKGAQLMSFQPIVASGVNGASPHARPTDKIVNEGEFVTMDFGANLDGYCSDMTRTVAVGKPSEKMVEMYNLVLEAQRLGIEFAKAGVKGCEIHNVAYDFFAKHGMEQYFGHGFGHGIGMEVHEGLRAAPACKKPLPENFFVSAEPGLYIENFCGVRIEDIICLKDYGYENITKSTKDLIIIK